MVLDPLRLAILGVGRMGSLHARVLSQLPGIDLRVVVDARAEQAERLAFEVGAEPMGTVEDLISRSDIEAWLIATPTPTHPDLVRTGLANGMHILCEKPLSLDPTEKFEPGDSILQIGFWRRFSPPWVVAKRLIDEGAIGIPLLVRLSQWDSDPPPASFCDPSVSGGLAIDCGVHEFDLAEWLTGRRVGSVVAKNLPIVDEVVGASGDVDNLVATLDLTGGVTAWVDLSRNARYGDDVRTEILGTDGAVFVDLLPEGRTRLADRNGVRLVEGSATGDATAAGVAAQAEAFWRAVRGDAIDIPGQGDSARAVATGRAVQRAALSSSRVTL